MNSLLVLIGLLFGLLLSIGNITAFNQVPKCENCKWFVKGFGGNDNLGLCKIFSTKVIVKNSDKSIYNFAQHCRDNEFLCGENGWLYEQNNHDPIKNKDYVNLLTDEQINQIESNTEEIFCQNNILFNLLKDQQIEKDFEYFNNKISLEEEYSYNKYMSTTRKLNIPKIYKKERDLYKLFKRN